jgi:glycosyltransferase involved in cell wall biosynthesis
VRASDHRIRVVHLLNDLRPSGAELMLAAAAETWERYGIDPLIVSMGQEEGSFAPNLRCYGYAIHHWPLKRSARSLFNLRQSLSRLEPHAVHVHAERLSFWTCLAAMSLRPRPVVVRTVHNVFQFDGALRFRRLLQRHILKALGTHFVSVSRDVAQNELYRFSLSSSTIENWVDVDSFRSLTDIPKQQLRRHLKLPVSGSLLIVVGNCSEAKDHPFALRVLRRLPPLFKLVHVGEEDAELVERSLARDLGISDRVIFLGRRQDVPSLLRACDAFLMPSDREGFPLAAIEALCAGIPLFLADVEGLRHIAVKYRAARLLPKEESVWSDSIPSMQPLIPVAQHESKSALSFFAPARGVDKYCCAYRQKASGELG